MTLALVVRFPDRIEKEREGREKERKGGRETALTWSRSMSFKAVRVSEKSGNNNVIRREDAQTFKI